MSIFGFILVAAMCFQLGQTMMKDKVARQIDYGVKHQRIRIEVDGQSIESTAALYSVICAKSYPQK